MGSSIKVSAASVENVLLVSEDLPNPLTTDDIEVCIYSAEPNLDDNVGLQLFEIYAQVGKISDGESCGESCALKL